MSLHEKLVSTVIQDFIKNFLISVSLTLAFIVLSLHANIQDKKCIVTMLNLNGKPFYCKCYCATLIFNHLDIKSPEIIHPSEIP